MILEILAWTALIIVMLSYILMGYCGFHKSLFAQGLNIFGNGLLFAISLVAMAVLGIVFSGFFLITGIINFIYLWKEKFYDKH